MTITTSPETEGITGKDGEVRLNDNSGHAIFVDKNTGRFIVRYKRDHDWDGPAPEDEDTDVIERRYDTMTDVCAFIDRRYETQQRVKKTPLNLRVLTERGPVVVKSIHGGTNHPIFDVPARQKKDWERFTKGYGAQSGDALYPDHEHVAGLLEQVQNLLGRKDEIERQIRETREKLAPFVISAGYRTNDEGFRKACFDALAKVTTELAESS